MRSSRVLPVGHASTDVLPGIGFLNTQEAARYLSISAKDLERMRREGRGPRWVKLSRKLVRYSVADLNSWVAEHTVSNTAVGKALVTSQGGAR